MQRHIDEFTCLVVKNPRDARIVCWTIMAPAKSGEDNLANQKILSNWPKSGIGFGTGGTSKRSAGHGRLIYAMRVNEKPTREEYYRLFPRTRPDNKPPQSYFEKRKQFALVSRHFYYFGTNAIKIPKEFKLEKKGPGFRCDFDQEEISDFIDWLKKQSKLGKHGKPCAPLVETPKEKKPCK